MPLLHTGKTDVPIENESAALQLISDGTTYRLPTTTPVNFQTAFTRVSGDTVDFEYKSNRTGQWSRTTSQTITGAQDIGWQNIFNPLGSLWSWASSVISVPAEGVYKCYLTVSCSSISGGDAEFELVDSSNTPISQGMKCVIHTGSRDQSCVVFTFSTIGTGDLDVKIRQTNASSNSTVEPTGTKLVFESVLF